MPHTVRPARGHSWCLGPLPRRRTRSRRNASSTARSTARVPRRRSSISQTGRTTPVASDVTGTAVFTSDGEFVIRTVSVGQGFESRVRHVSSGIEATLGATFVRSRSPIPVRSRCSALSTASSPDSIPRASGAGRRAVPASTRRFNCLPTARGSSACVPTVASWWWTRNRAASCATRRSASCRSSWPRPTGPRSSWCGRRSTGPELARLDTETGQALVARPSLMHPLAVGAGPLHHVPGGTRLIESELVVGTPGNTRIRRAAGGLRHANHAAGPGSAALAVPTTPGDLRGRP